MDDGLPDAELLRCAQSGDVAALGVLLQRHQAPMRAVALSVLGHGPDAEDALQDSALTALRRIGDVRDPAAVGAWLRAVVRNTCRMRFRRGSTDVLPGDLVSPRADERPDAVLETHALRDWIWTALGTLTPPLQLVLMLRHFSDVTTYDQIAAACGLPVGTVRSRLHQARAKLATALLTTAEREHDSAALRHRASHREAVDTLAAAEAGRFADVVADRWSPHVTLTGQGRTGGRDLLLAAMDADLAAGVRQRPVHAVAGAGVTVWEMDLSNPRDDPAHCPPSVVWLMRTRDGRVDRLRLFHPVAP
ncbi:RNA polymerase sigma factor [Amycolatopsis sp. NPDC088138]|uniref:RNA polymerase sigma factor n=1 Tax=Amycolatopsis sp. NPDC088138 TaxID=3363938 RepID=UPI003816ADCA